MDDAEFELVYLMCTSDGPQRNLSNWKIEAFVRYVGKSAASYWKFSRGKDAVPVQHEVMSHVDIAVYLKTTRRSTDEMKEHYMQYMGANIDSYCPVHKLALTTCPLGRGNYCCNKTGDTQCHKAAAYECPFCGCQTFLCKSCIGITFPMEEIGEDEEADAMSCMSGESNMIADSENCSIGGDDVWSTCTNVGNKNELNCSQCILDEDETLDMLWSLDNWREGEVMFDAKFDEDAENVEPLGPEMLLPDSYLENDNVNLQIDDDSSGDSGEFDDAVDEHHFIIPTTDASKVACRVETNKERTTRFGLHVLLNEHGSLLVRRYSHLKPSRAAKGFLEQIVATSDGTSIPLLYPEAMLFPSIFWKQGHDGSCDGAIPVGLWTDASTANTLGFASIEDHMRCRLKNSSLLCSTDPCYIYFAFDLVNNVMARGVDNRIVLRRGFEHMLGPCKLLGETNDSMLCSDMIDSRRNVHKLAALVRDKEPTFFYTHTCNQTEHFGIAPLRKALNEKLEFLLHNHDMSDRDCKALCDDVCTDY